MSSRFLFFLYYYPPTPGTPARRNFQISNTISEHSDFSKIYTATSQEGQKKQPGDTEIETLPTYDYRYFLRRKTKDGALSEEKKKRWWMQLGIRLINTFPLNLVIGEGGLIYLNTLIKHAGKDIAAQKITHIYSSYRPFADHYAAYKLKRRNPELVWIADFRDLIIDPHYNHIFFKSGHHRFFRRLFSRADVLTTVSDGLAKKLQRYNPDVLTIRNGIQNVPDHIAESHCKYFKIAYTGSMFLDKRNAEPLFVAVRDLINKKMMVEDHVRIIYAGKDSLIWQALASRLQLDNILVDKGIISGQEATAIQKEACVNVLLTISSKELQGVLTGKMIEYFESGSPILAIIVGQNDPELKFIFNEIEIGDSFSDQPSDLPGITDFIYQEYIHWKNTGMNRKPVNLKMLKEKYSIEATMKPLLERIEAIK